MCGKHQQTYSMTEQKEAEVTQKFKSFLADMVRFGSVKGFRYLAMYMRGREEMLISVINEPADADNYSLSSEPASPLSVSSGNHFSLNASFTSGNLPYDKRTLLLSSQAQQNPVGLGETGLGLPPASPSDGELTLGDPNTTLFLLAGYAKYACPYVWVRSNHDRLAQYTGKRDQDRDNPLKLKSVRKYPDADIKVWDVVAEIVKLCTYPPPRNPFAVDFSYFDHLQPTDCLLATGAMVYALQKVIASKMDDKYYTARVMDDLQHVSRVHFEALQGVATQRRLPCLEDYLARSVQQQQQQQQQQQAKGRSRHSSIQHGHYPQYPQGGYGYAS